MKNENCKYCGKKIPKARLKALPDTETCVKCSDCKPVVGFGEGTDFIIVDQETAERLRKLEKIDGRLNRLK